MARLQTSRFALTSISCFCLVLLASCHNPQLPKQYSETGIMPKIYPDYIDVTIPVNIAPLCFQLMSDADEALTRFTANGQELIVEGRKCRPDIDEWHTLLAHAVDSDITVEVFAAKCGQWARFRPFLLHVSPDSIDSYLCYRLISPSYVSYEELTINQRCLQNFHERVIADNMLCSNESGGQCINCHSFQRNNPDRMQLHARQTHAGTIIAYDGKVENEDFNSHSSTPSNYKPQYPAWHPTEKLIAYSTNSTMQAFHTVHTDKIEVYDSQSSLLLYDLDHHNVTPIEHIPNELETHPTWSPDGRFLYYCSANFQYKADTVDLEEVTLRTQELKYNIWRRPFNAAHTFGPPQLVFRADSLNMSAAQPRISPDGRWLLFSMSQYGTFHIWHSDADLWIMDLHAPDQPRPLVQVNSNSAESYHSWSSTGRWIVISSRRNDGVFTRPFFAHVDANGQATKPFELPSQDPDLHRQLLKSYNVPEFTRGPISLTPQQIAAKLKDPQ